MRSTLPAPNQRPHRTLAGEPQTVGQEMMETQEYSVISVMGPHAGEDSTAIFARKIADIHNVGRTFWVIRSHKAKPNMIQRIAAATRARSNEPLCAFLSPSAPGGAVPTKTASANSHNAV